MFSLLCTGVSDSCCKELKASETEVSCSAHEYRSTAGAGATQRVHVPEGTGYGQFPGQADWSWQLHCTAPGPQWGIKGKQWPQMAFGTRQDADTAEEELADVTAESLSSFKGCGDKERLPMT